MRKRFPAKPKATDVLDVLPYRFVFLKMAKFFQQMQMHSVSAHIKAASEELDRIWDENDFDAAQWSSPRKSGHLK
jgi:hypothetical protein